MAHVEAFVWEGAWTTSAPGASAASASTTGRLDKVAVLFNAPCDDDHGRIVGMAAC